MTTKIVVKTSKGRFLLEKKVDPAVYTLADLRTELGKTCNSTPTPAHFAAPNHFLAKINQNRLRISTKEKVVLRDEQMTFADYGLAQRRVNLVMKDLGL